MVDTTKIISRSSAEALIPVEVSREIIKDIPLQSPLLSLMRRLPNMTAKQRTMPVLASLPEAHFLNGDTDRKKTTNASWANKTITAEELAVIVPIPEAVLDDASYDIWGEIRPHIVAAFVNKITAAILFGTNKPSSWPTALIPAAIAKNHVITNGTNVDLASDIIGKGGLMQKVEADGYRVNGFFADTMFEADLRDLRNANRDLLYSTSLTAGTPDTLVGRNVYYDGSGVFDYEQALMLAGDFSKALYAMRQDITYKVLDQAVIQNEDGSIAYNLAQQDMVALRCVMRIGFQTIEPINERNAGNADRYPFAVLKPAVAQSSSSSEGGENNGGVDNGATAG